MPLAYLQSAMDHGGGETPDTLAQHAAAGTSAGTKMRKMEEIATPPFSFLYDLCS